MKNTFSVCNGVVFIRIKRRDGCVLTAAIDEADLVIADAITSSWFVQWSESSHTYYVYAGTWAKGKRSKVYLHRLITGAPSQLQVDHSDHNGLNNRRFNLIATNQSANQINRRGPNKNSCSGIIGVHWVNRTKRWQAKLTRNGIEYYFGQFDSRQEAHVALLEGLAVLRKKK